MRASCRFDRADIRGGNDLAAAVERLNAGTPVIAGGSEEVVG
jgi:hypothetical protein